MMKLRNVCRSFPLLFLLTHLVDGSSKSQDNSQNSVITNQRGVPVPSLTASLKIGHSGQILLSDTNFIDHLAHFVRERIPERVVHAKGSGALGYFEVTDDITMYTKAAPFNQIGKKTPVLVRFSTVGGELGSADTAHDPRGFALKFYTDEGNWDLVGNNLPIFMIRDPILFPSMVHSRKRHPQSHLPDPNMFWDFTSLRPETTFHTLMLFSDFGYPRSYREMNGAGVHTFKFVNNEGQSHFCKFHWLSEQGVKNMTPSKAEQLAGSNPDYLTADLFQAIANGEYPQWKLYVQIMTPEDAKSYEWNPFDITKLWREEDYPLIPVGRLVLNQNPYDYFSQVEMAAFCPGNLIPGIEMSPDPMLHGRSFSYGDAQRYRVGPNFLQLPVNSPVNVMKRPDHYYTYQRDGQGIIDNGYGNPNYFPNTLDLRGNSQPAIDATAKESTFSVSDIVDRFDSWNDDNFSQSKWYLDSLTSGERSRLVRNLAKDLIPVTDVIQKRALKNFASVDPKFADEIKSATKKRGGKYGRRMRG